MNILFLKLYITEDVDNKFYNSQEIGMAKALVDIHPEHRVDIVLLSNKISEERSSEISPGITLHLLPGKGIGHHGIIDLNIIRKYKPDVVHLLADNMLFAPNVIRYCKKNGIKCHAYIGTLFTDSKNLLRQKLDKVMMRRNIKAYKTIPVYAKTPTVLDKCKKSGIDAKLAPVGMGKEEAVLSERTGKEIREEFKLPKDKKILLFVGRLEEYKHPLDAVDVLQKLDDSYVLLVVGKGPLQEGLTRKIAEYDLQKRVIQFEKVPNVKMRELFKACDGLLNFNPVEIYGMTILESMCHGCPVFAVKAPGPCFMIKNRETGFICESITEMADRIEEYAENKDSNYKDLTYKSREYILHNLMWENTIRAIDDWNEI